MDRAPIDVRPHLEAAQGQSPEARGISTMARGLVGSAILAIAGEVRQKIAAGESLLNLTVGDFAPAEFPIPPEMATAIQTAVAEGHTNYPPARGLESSRQAVQRLFSNRLGLDYPVESILVASGGRASIAGAYLALVNPGDEVVFGLPSWNNHYYCTITGATPVTLPTTADQRFFFDPAGLGDRLSKARLLVLNTPMNPTGTVLGADELGAICDQVIAENNRRQTAGEPALYVMFDQIYWLLTFDGYEHVDPVRVRPEMAKYTIFVDGISKWLAGTGLRVGWAVGPTDVVQKMATVVSHLGAWAPKPEQVATAAFLNDDDALDRHVAKMQQEVRARLHHISEGIEALAAKGWPVGAIPPQGAIYLSVRIDLKGRSTKAGETLTTDEDVRRFLLNEAGIAVIPFSCFGVEGDTGWFRASVGAVSKEDCASIGTRLERAFDKLA